MAAIPRALHPTESAFMAQVVRHAEVMGFTAWHDLATNARRRCTHCGAVLKLARNAPGFPDLLLVRDRVLFRELKVKGGRLTTDQELWSTLLTSAGADYKVWTPDMWDEIGEQLR